MIAIIDYGMGNLYSVEKAFVKLGTEVAVSSDPLVIAAAEKVVLPGVGAFGDCMDNLQKCHLVPVIHKVIQEGKPFLGICLGLQVLFEGSEEDPGVKGLGVFPGMIRKIVAPGMKIPQMGWNSLLYRNSTPLFAGLPETAYVYFVHSFHAVPENPEVVTAVTDYGGPVTAAVGRGNVQAVQFHPEKSSSIGLDLLRNFVQMKA
ncbi:Imidazole glycerol phosphate synthase subunit HisH [Propionispora sp. 2/2-37]|uniref:imidazole glycerol phosphate synthase subunit HisH n=1 Tax=Propionispora sp. 2/2-37 TaxID=1677858 RepID=UPI0006BB63BF|nr:imidazole glycerol phosphate synthase subunit HisH [Propionispora sp. 2/2-37]CUH96339.1 Imidazole glycerol phosphate synthase subunit HisH [Propionispora sp. 2/2-37]